MEVQSNCDEERRLEGMKTGPHRPSQIIAEDYEYVLSYSLATQVDGWPIPPINIDLVVELQNTKPFVTRGPGKCTVCGTHFIYGDVWVHRPTGEHIHIGHECADKYSLIAERADWEAENGAVRRKAAREHGREMKRERREAFLAEFPGLEEDLQTDHPIVEDIAARFKRYPSLSEKQIELVRKLAHEARNPKPEEKYVSAPTGKQTFRGKVVSVKAQETMYGTSLKATIKIETPEGIWLAWGTAPQGLLDATSNHGGLRGCEVEIKATLERGRDDHFVFMKRPRGKLLAFGEEHDTEKCHGCYLENQERESA
jgi:hypothetical protein